MLSRFAEGDEELRRQLNARRRLYRRPDLHDHFGPAPSKRILALDGGGVRSAMTIAILEKIEDILSRRHGNHSSFRLADYFDLIGGTSTGAVLAAALAAKAVKAPELRDLYAEVTNFAFKRSGFDPKKFDKILTQIFGSETLGGDLATGLAVVARRVDNDRTLVFHNNPDGPEFVDAPHRAKLGAANYPIANVIRASTARPGAFTPEDVILTRSPHLEEGVFIDAGFTPFNNPAFQLYLLATSESAGFNWAIGREKLLVTSVGTGSLCNEIPSDRRLRKASRSHLAQRGLKFMIDGAEHTGEMLMQLLSDPDTVQHDRCTVADLGPVRLTPDPQCTYRRYQAKLTARALSEDLKIGLTTRQLGRVRNMLDHDGFQIAYEIGQAVADSMIREDQFPEAFDLERVGLPSTDDESATSAPEAVTQGQPVDTSTSANACSLAQRPHPVRTAPPASRPFWRR